MEAGDVRSHNVGGKLCALEAKTRGFCQRGCKRGLTRAGYVLNQHVRAGKHGGHEHDDLISLAYDNLLNLGNGSHDFAVCCLHFGGHGGSIVLAFGVHNSCTSFQKLYEVIITHFVSILQEFQTPLVHFLHAKKKIYNFLIIKKAAPWGCFFY